MCIEDIAIDIVYRSISSLKINKKDTMRFKQHAYFLIQSFIVLYWIPSKRNPNKLHNSPKWTTIYLQQ